jgi:hypothetical protein
MSETWDDQLKAALPGVQFETWTLVLGSGVTAFQAFSEAAIVVFQAVGS